VVLGSTQSLTKISIRDTSRGRGECGRYVGLTTLPLSTGTLRLPWLKFLHSFSSVVRQIPGYNSQRRGTARTLPN